VNQKKAAFEALGYDVIVESFTNHKECMGQLPFCTAVLFYRTPYWPTVKDLIDESLKGFNVAIFAFGMTGSGKTHTISGTSHMPGIVPRTVYHVFSDLRLKAQQSKDSIVPLALVQAAFNPHNENLSIPIFN
jgi:hypothetical protein